MRPLKPLFWTLLLLCFAPTLAFAQDDICAAFVQTVIQSTRENCAELSANHACYGSPEVTLELRDSAEDAEFSAPGDQLGLGEIDTLISTPFNPEAENWGLVQMNVRANLPGQNVTMLAFGGLELVNNSQAGTNFIALPVTVQSATGANVRAEPSEAANIATTLITGQELRAFERTQDGAWLRVITANGEGWVSSRLLTSEADLTALPITTPGESSLTDTYAAMQSFTFTTPQIERACSTAPESGLLLQTPDESTAATFIVNSLQITFNGTLFLQAYTPADVSISVLEGTAAYTDQTLQAGQRLRLSYDGNSFKLLAPVEEYAFVRARELPLVLLPREFELPFALGDVIFPFAPGTGFLSSLAPDAPCTVAWTSAVNLRSGPGTNYQLRRGVAGGFYSRPDARAVGSDGALWWRLADRIWVAADNTAAGGACGTLSLIPAPPPES